MGRTHAGLSLLDGPRDWSWVDQASNSVADTQTLLSSWYTDPDTSLHGVTLARVLLERAALGPAHLRVLLHVTEDGSDYSDDEETIFDTFPVWRRPMVEFLWTLPYLDRSWAAVLLTHPHLVKTALMPFHRRFGFERGFYAAPAVWLVEAAALRSRIQAPHSPLEVARVAAVLEPSEPNPTHLAALYALAPTWDGTAAELRATVDGIIAP